MDSERIGFDARYISDRYHGIGRYGFGLLEALSRLAKGRTFVVFMGKDTDSRFDWESLRCRPNIEIQTGPWPMYWPQEQIQWPDLLVNNRISLFHSPYFVLPLLAPKAIRKIVTVHDLIFDRFPEYMPQRWSRPYYRALMRWGTQQATRVLTVSQATAKDLWNYYGTPSEKISVVTEGVDRRFQPLSDHDQLQTILQKYDLPQSFILSVGARRPHKNHAALVQAFALIRKATSHDLVFVGPADKRFIDRARSEVDRLGLVERVHFIDWVDERDLPGLYNLADLVVLPSLIEGFGLPALEAMACGTPVIASNNSSFPEVLGESGILVDSTQVGDLANAMENGLAKIQLRQRLGMAGLARARHYTWDAAALQVLDIYAEVTQFNE